MNFAREILEGRPAGQLALVELARDGSRREWTFGETRACSARLAAELVRRGVRRGDVVMTLIGNRPEWVFTMMACFRTGAVALPCTEQLRAKDLALRIAVTRPRLIVADERNRQELQLALSGDARARDGEIQPPEDGPGAEDAGPGAEDAGSSCEVLWVPDGELPERDGGPPPPYALLEDNDPCLITFTSGTSGEPKAVLHAQRYLQGQRVQAGHWLGAAEGDLVWCTAASGWSKSARNVFIAPWLSGAAALLHDARFDPHERLELIERERVNVLCMAPTEFRVIAKRATLRPLPSLRGMVAAGEALNPEVLHAWKTATGLDVRDGYGQTETGQMTAMPLGAPARPGSMGRPLPGVKLSVVDGELVADPRTVPTFFLGYLGEGVHRREAPRGEDVHRRETPGDRRAHPDDAPRGEDAHPDEAPGGEGVTRTAAGGWEIEDRRDGGPWHTGDRVSQDADGFLHFEGRADDVIISAGYRIGPFEVESALVAHPAVAEAAAVASRDEERGSVVRAIVVLRDGHSPSPELARELQNHVKRVTAPYKYPRIVDFAEELPKTASGKIRRAQLRKS